jgi:predicted RNase H-like HicB family nuclease
MLRQRRDEEVTLHRLTRLREIRQRASVSQEELARRSETARATIAELEADRGRLAQPRTARRIADALGVDVGELYGEPGRAREATEAGPERSLALTAIYEQGEHGWWVARCPEIPGAITQGRTLEEARSMLQEAVRDLMEIRREEALRRTEGRPNTILEPLGLGEETTEGGEDAG